MALLTKSGYNKILRKIMETENLSEDLIGSVDRLTGDFDERENLLRSKGQVIDTDDVDEYDYIENVVETESKDSEWKRKYEEVNKLYLDRFFGLGGSTEDEVEIDTVEQFQEELTIDDLLYENKED